jgi:class 3 adenylate cyclase
VGRIAKAEPPRSLDGAGRAAAGLPLQPAGTACATHGEQIRRLKRFLAPQVAQFVLSCDEGELLRVKRREITVLFCDLRGFTAFAEVAAPEDVMEVLRRYHHTLGSLVTAHDGTLERFTGDGVMVYFDQPTIEEQAAKAIRLALRIRERVSPLCAEWRRWGYDLGLGIGIALGFASVGTIGFDGRYDYAAIGPVTNLASRLCAHAAPGQILVSQRLYASIQDAVAAEPVGSLTLGGFHAPIPAYSVRGLQASADEDPAP